MPPGKSEARRQTGRREKLTGLPGAYYFAPIVQAPAAPVRCCVLCGCIVTNFNLGGHDSPCAFRGALWCLLCADGRSPQ